MRDHCTHLCIIKSNSYDNRWNFVDKCPIIIGINAPYPVTVVIKLTAQWNFETLIRTIDLASVLIIATKLSYSVDRDDILTWKKSTQHVIKHTDVVVCVWTFGSVNILVSFNTSTSTVAGRHQFDFFVCIVVDICSVFTFSVAFHI